MVVNMLENGMSVEDAAKYSGRDKKSIIELFLARTGEVLAE